MSNATPSIANNVGVRLAEVAATMPEALAVAEPTGRKHGITQYRRMTFGELDRDSDQIAAGLRQMGIPAAARIVLLVRPGIDFVSLVIAMLKARLVMVLIDPGMGRANLMQCLQEVEPEGFVAISAAQAVRTLYRRRFPKSRFHVTVGRRWFWGGPTLAQLRRGSARLPDETYDAQDQAAVIFTTGSTGVPKGVLYRHQNFLSQIEQIAERYGIRAGEVDLPGFPLFALFNCVMGVTTVFPQMDFTRPADVDPRNIIDPINQWNIPQSFGSPALWNTVSRYCEKHGATMPSLKRVLSAGAPVPPHVLQRLKNAIHPDGDIHTPYGATESLPVASIAASEVLRETAELSRIGRGTCVGHRYAEMQWKVIRISDQPIHDVSDVEELPRGKIGELMVSGPVVTREYVTRADANADHKVRDGDRIWHRMGDVGYLDDQERFWFCGRKAHRVLADDSTTLFTIPCEAVLNEHPAVYRTALVGVGPVGRQVPVIVFETWPEHTPQTDQQREQIIGQLRELAAKHDITSRIEHFLWHPSLPVDIRHNSKIFREQLTPWAAEKLGTRQ